MKKKEKLIKSPEKNTPPTTWVLLLLATLPMLSESMYSPLLIAISQRFAISAAVAEYTISIYLFGFAFGVLCWGRFSDFFGRKPCIVMGLSFYAMATILCYDAQSIQLYMIGRIGQAIGLSACSVLTQSICRDSFRDKQLGRIYSNMSIAFAFFSALGPITSLAIYQYMGGWENIFLLLIMVSLLTIILVTKFLPETLAHKLARSKENSLWQIGKKMLCDPVVLGFAGIIAICKGISFSYFAEGPFYLMQSLELSKNTYGWSFTYIYIGTMLSGMLSKRLYAKKAISKVFDFGLGIMLLGALSFVFFALFSNLFQFMSKQSVAYFSIFFILIIKAGICITVSNALALALINYQQYIGSASALFGSFYYVLTSGVTFGMGMLSGFHLLAMPLYFLFLVLLALAIRYFMLNSLQQACEH